MNLDENMRTVIEKKLSDSNFEKIIADQLEQCVSGIIKDLLREYGDVGEVIKKKIKDVMLPAIERHDFTDYVVKLDTVLTEIVNNTALVENRKLLENFKYLMIEDGAKTIKASELFKRWCNYVSENVETAGLEVNFDDGSSYESVAVSMVVEQAEGRSWSDIHKASIIFECPHDETMNVLLPISNWTTIDGNNWSIDYKQTADIDTLRYLSSFEVFLLRLKRGFCKIELDVCEIEEEVIPVEEPNVSWS